MHFSALDLVFSGSDNSRAITLRSVFAFRVIYPCCVWLPPPGHSSVLGTRMPLWASFRLVFIVDRFNCKLHFPIMFSCKSLIPVLYKILEHYGTTGPSGQMWPIHCVCTSWTEYKTSEMSMSCLLCNRFYIMEVHLFIYNCWKSPIAKSLPAGGGINLSLN
jgi:hypothetical protein